MSRITAEATAEPVVNRVYADARGQSVAESASTAITDRLAFLNGAEQPYATTELVATRFAAMSGASEAGAALPVTATRFAWMAAAPMVAESVSTGAAERWKITSGESIADSSAVLAGGAVTRFAMQRSRGTPAQARSWVAEALIERLRVRQQFGRGTPVGRATVRAIANSAIGRGELRLYSDVLADNARVNIYHAFTGSTSGTVDSIVYPDRVRIIVGGLLATAEARLEPTITTGGQRLSYNAGVSAPSAQAALQPTVVRRPTLVGAAAETVVVEPSTYYVRGVKGKVQGTGSLELDYRVNPWKYIAGLMTGEATSAIDLTLYRSRSMAGVVDAAASLVTTANVLRDPVTGLVGTASAMTTLAGVISRYVDAVADAEGASQSATTVLRLVAGTDDAAATLDIEAFARRGRIMSGSLASESASAADALRIVWADGVPRNAVSSTTRFIFRINIDSDAPTRRTVQVPYTDRHLALAGSSREYRVA
jgi:hypothetical protein